MAQVTREANEMFEDKFYEDWQEWKDGDDSALYDSGYYDGVIKAVEILDSVRAQPEVDRLPSSFTVSVVIATLREIAKGN
jgi:hypothetical protein